MAERVSIDGGFFGPVGNTRIIETDTLQGETSDRRYSIHPADPPSACATMQQNMNPEGGNWKVRIRYFSTQSATKTDFHLLEKLQCWLGGELFHQIEREHIIPRNGA